MTRPARLIRSLQWSDEGVAMEFITLTEDLKANGVVLNHVLTVPAGDDYDDELEALTEAAHALLEDVLEDLPRLDPLPLEIEGPDDNDNDED